MLADRVHVAEVLLEAPLVAEPERFLPALLRALRYEVEPFHAEPWLAEELARLWRTLPRFRLYWAIAAREPAPVSADRPLVPLRLAVPGAGPLEFRLASERFTRDARFRLIYFLPADPETMRWCAEQAERSAAAESGVRSAVLDDAAAGSPSPA